jgi:hypothetical protein
MGHGGLGPDEYGFNPPIVEMFKKRWGTDIRHEEFDSSRLHQLNGEIFTGLLQEIRKIIGSHRRLIVGCPLDGYVGFGGEGGAQFGTRLWKRLDPIEVMPSFRIDLDWKQWMDEGIVDDLVIYAPPGLVEEIAEKFKAGSKGKILLERETDVEELYPAYEADLEKIRAGALDGYLIDESKDYEPAHTRWCNLLKD